MSDRIESKQDVEALLDGLSDPERHRVITGAIEDIDAQIADVHRRQAQLTRRRQQLAERMGYPSGYLVD
jgi:phage shock protein A